MSCFPTLRLKSGVCSERRRVERLVPSENQLFEIFALICFLPRRLNSCCLLLGFDLRSAQVVSLATGTKCLDSDSVSDRGGTLSDCHAEVVSRRALVRFLYAQLELLLRYDPETLPDT